jgi:hypothetical protein
MQAAPICGTNGLLPQRRKEKHIMEITYTQVGDYLIPDIKLSEPQPNTIEPLGRYARMRKAYLKEHRTILYNTLLLSERLFPHLREIDEAAAHRIATIPDREVAHEIILDELVYCD